MANFMTGFVQPYDLDNKENWTEWSERFDAFLLANAIVDDEKKKATLIACLGGPGYKLLRSLCQNDVSTNNFAALKQTMKDHLQPVPNKIAERFRFYKRDRKSGEIVSTYLAELRKLIVDLEQI